ncbi:Zn-dependent hydrolase [Candidatus Pacearchaeota archaeon]|nr:Zn-dependent hydrolase [Candidatus Pacearchaeota archaeon]|tara:strand:- start:5833 stop:6504 length:672 start_codon:yes stop_codon:yes gene_type:complete
MEIGDIKLDFLGHSGFLIEDDRGKRIAIDPYNLSSAVGDVDLILITHSHYDHCSIKDIEKIRKEGTVIVVPADAQSKITKCREARMEIIESGEKFSFGQVKIEAVPAYNVDKEFHPKQEGWLGYVIKIGNVIIYHSGDSDKIPEMKNLTGYGKHGTEFVALLPVSGKYVMNVEEAVETASMLNPNLAIPMHYGAGVAGTREDAERFAELCKEINLKAQVLEKI